MAIEDYSLIDLRRICWLLSVGAVEEEECNKITPKINSWLVREEGEWIFYSREWIADTEEDYANEEESQPYDELTCIECGSEHFPNIDISIQNGQTIRELTDKSIKERSEFLKK